MSNPYESPNEYGSANGKRTFGSFHLAMGLLAIGTPGIACFLASFSVSPDLIGVGTAKHSSVVVLSFTIVFLFPLLFLKVLRRKFILYSMGFMILMSVVAFVCYRYLLIALIGV